MHPIHRRDFLKATAAVAATAAIVPQQLFADVPPPPSRLVVVHGTDIPLMMKTGIEAMGGWGAYVKPGKKVTLKPNAAWASTAEQGANTHPEMVEDCIRACQAAGASSVVLPENSCSPSKRSFEMSGIAKVAKSTGAKLYEPDDDTDFVTVEIPQGQSLTQVDVARDVLETDCLINMPVAKNHGGAGMTVSMKNWMGSVKDRSYWHRNNLHQCIADFSTFIKPDLIIVDATRIMLTNGPRGPGKLARPNQIIFGTDPVAVDAYVATLLDKDPLSFRYIQLAQDMGVGSADLSAVEHLET
jgi:uncharacterized protein (DUF362 family)